MANIQENENAQENARDFSTNYLERLKLRELSNKGNLGLNGPGNMYLDYHLHQYYLCNFQIQHIVVVDDVICVIYGETSLINGGDESCYIFKES